MANVLSTINEELQESLGNEKRFIASVSHELGTPMTSIIGYGELMSDTNLDSTQQRYLTSIRIYEVEMLKNFFGVMCDTAENGAIAVKKAKENEYDAILMDVRMPVMNGLIATRKIREFNQDVPIICMSANVYKEDKIAAEEAGMNDFIEKPLERIDIENKLVKLIEKGFGVYVKEKINYKQIVKNNLRENFDETIATQLCVAAMNSISEGLENINTHTKEKDLSSLTEEFHRLKGVVKLLEEKE
ncbi:MAG TPA: response regulator [Campylobacterales bacterium]|nr:response regulator [Campylobacterales bacterium]